MNAENCGGCVIFIDAYPTAEGERPARCAIYGYINTLKSCAIGPLIRAPKTVEEVNDLVIQLPVQKDLLNTTNGHHAPLEIAEEKTA